MLDSHNHSALSNEAIRRASEAAVEFISNRYAAREVVGVIANEAALDKAIDELMSNGFDRSQISILGNKNQIAGTITALEDDPNARTQAPVSPSSRSEFEAAAVGMPIFIAGVGSYAFVIASGGSLAVALAALMLAGAAGGGVGGLIAHRIARRHRTGIERQIANGGLLLWVGVRNALQETKAREVLSAVEATDVHVHEIEREWGMKDIPFHNVQPDPILENEHRDGL